MINRDDLTPEERELYDRSYIGTVDRLDREWRELKRAIYNALPYALRRLIDWARGI